MIMGFKREIVASVPRMLFERWLLGGIILTVLIVSQGAYAQLTAVNVALNKPIVADVTCGNPAETFLAHIESLQSAQDRVQSVCDAENASLAHPPESMVDVDSSVGEDYTWWQSTSRVRLIQAGYSNPQSEIILDLQEVHTVESLTLQMGDSVRPGQVGLEKSLDGLTFAPWSYQVTDLSECMSEFATSPVTAVVDVNSIVCTTFLSSEQPRNEMIMFSMNAPAEAQDWQRARYIKINFFNMPLSFGFFSDEFHHFTVRNLEVQAQCECNGHATECTLQPLTSDSSKMTYQCVCGGNTQGGTCSECLPFYNQLAYQQGTEGFVCQECNCFGHSEVCVYDEAVARLNGSLNAAGEYMGGGVCQDCTDFTAGTNCHQCLQFYYRPADREQTAMDACQPCECFLPGTRDDPNTGLVRGECVMNTDTPNPAGMLPGDCYCKVNVQGSKCDECMDGYYDLTDANTNGCIGCDCFTSGTIDESNVCNKNETGQCPCKTSVTGRHCDACRNGYYGLASANQDGCLECGCDVGGAESHICDEESGACPCRSLVIGQQCDSVAEGAFYPTLHSLSAEFESMDDTRWRRDVQDYSGIGYLELSGLVNTSTTLTIPPSLFSGEFHIVLRAITEGSTTVDITIKPVGEASGSVEQRGVADLPACLTTWCYDGLVDNVDPLLENRFVLGEGEWQITAGINTQGGARVLLDQVIAIPVEYTDDTGALLGQQTAEEFAATCDIQTNDMRLETSDETFCLANVFSLTVFYFDGAQRCDCDPVGSVGLTCIPYGGQCTCKGGVGGRPCDSCLPEYFSFRSTGCTACDCFGDDKVCDVITGQCNCPPNTAGRRCDRCVTFTWGLNSTTGCKACECDATGSVSLQCDQLTGQCPCQPGVGGPDCSVCLDGYKQLSSDGCKSCDCDVDGSLSPTCDAETGQCLCKMNTEGLLCDTCLAGTFYNNEAHPTGCLDCVCMGITDLCGSTSQRSVQYSVPTDEGGVDMWSLILDPPLSQDPPPALETNRTADAGFLSVALNQGIQAFWLLPLTDFSGNLLGIYGQIVTFDLMYVTESSGSSAAGVAADVTISIQGPDGELTFDLGPVGPDEVNRMSVEISERVDWTSTATGQPVSRAQFLTILTAVDSVLVSATLTSEAHVSSIGNVRYDAATSSDSPFYTQSAPTALAVEECVCGPQYAGLSCEECASGFYRVNASSHSFFGVCEPCECNGHSNTCDPATGQCLDCQDNTGGFNCEICLDGYYGDATNGSADACQQCPCGAPTALSSRCDKINEVVTCLDCAPGHLGALCNICESFYYGAPESAGGFCQPCECNGNTDSCDSVTGECLGCQFSTTGFNCESCQNFTFGDASQQDCRDCNCDQQGSASLLCDTVSGQCPCLPGVGGTRRCTACLENYYGFGALAGCVECGCNEFGSTTLQCDGGGVCSCLAGVNGEKCDACEDGSYGLPDEACMACGCDPLGTVGGAQAVCDPFQGQCPCEDGVMGRVCDECLPGFINFSANGCTKCDQCVDTLYNSTLGLESLHSQLLELGASIEGLQLQDAQLRTLDPVVVATGDALEELESMFSSLRTMVEAIDVSVYEQNVTQLADTASRLAMVMNDLQVQATLQYDQLTSYQTAAQHTLTNILSANATVNEYMILLTGYNESAAVLVSDAELRRDAVAVLMVAEQRAMIEAELGRAGNVSLEADALLAMVTAQGRELNRLILLVSAAEDQLQTTLQLVTITHSALDQVEAILEDTDTVLNDTQTNQAYSNELLTQAETTLASVMQTLAESTQAITDADQTLQEASVIYTGSSLGSAAIPLDPQLNIDQQGVNGWVDGHGRVMGQLGVVQGSQDDLEVAVQLAEAVAEQVDARTQESLRFFSTAQPLGQLAVDTVHNYQDVTTTIEEAAVTGQNATESLASTEEYIQTRTVATLTEEAQQSLQASTDQRELIEGSVTDQGALSASLDTANETLQSAIASWDTIRAEVANLESEVNALSALAADPDIQPAIDAGMQEANDTRDTANGILQETVSLEARLDTDEGDIVFIQDNVNNASMLVSGLPNIVTQIETDLQSMMTDVASLQSLQNETSILRSGIDDRIARLREKLRQAQTSIADSDQPVRLTGQGSLAVVREVDQLALFNEIQLDVRPGQRDGLVFFVENPERGSFLSVEVVASQLSFRFRINQEDVVSVTSPIDVCCDEWYRVLATRYADGGELTVTLQSTGGSSTTFARSFSLYDRFLAFQSNSTFFVGGIPQDYQTDNVLSRDFEGCVGSVSFDGQKLDLWRPTMQQGSASCCTAAVTPVDPEVTYEPGVSFDGFGYYQVSQDDFDVYQQARISLEFRTVLKEGVLFSVTRPDLISYIGLYIVDGHVIFEMNTAGNARYSVPSVGRYDDGQWYQVTTTFNSSHYSLELRYSNETSSLLEGSTRRTLASLFFPNIQFSPRIFLAGTDPNQDPAIQRGPTQLGFAGNMRNFGLSNLTSLELGPREITNTSSLPYKGVSFSGYPEEVIPGVGFNGDLAYMLLPLAGYVPSVETVKFMFKTTQPHGILTYSYDFNAFNKLLYVTLYHGNIFVQYNFGDGLSDPLQTRGLKLNTGQWQEVVISFNGLTASLKVNDLPVIYGATQLSSVGIPINGYLFIGGVISSIPTLIGGDYPIRQSLEGDMLDFRLNDIYPNFNDPTLVTNYLGIDLTGVQPPVPDLPPLPYSTPPSPTGSGVTPGSCASPTQVFPYPSAAGVIRFGLTPRSYVAIGLNSVQRKYFSSTFVLSFQFRALSAAGVMLYVANDYSQPTQFMALVMQDGYIILLLLDQSREFSQTTTQFKYDDAQWRTLTILKINGFLVLLISETKDYQRINNNRISDTAATLDVGTDLFVGGLGPQVLDGNYPLAATIVDSFNGCIRDLTISVETETNIPFPLNSPGDESMNVTSCRQNPIGPGGHFDGSGWLLLDSSYSLSTSWSVSLTISTTEQEALLVAIAADLQNFVVLELADGAARAVVGLGEPTSVILRSSQLASGYDLCDGNPHTLLLTIQRGLIEMTVDDQPVDSLPVNTQTEVAVSGRELYLGGISSADSMPLIPGIVTTPFSGCMQSVVIDDIEYDLHTAQASNGFTIGCPLPIP